MGWWLVGGDEPGSPGAMAATPAAAPGTSARKVSAGPAGLEDGLQLVVKSCHWAIQFFILFTVSNNVFVVSQ